MPVVRFIGRVLPTCVTLSLDGIPIVVLEEPTLGPRLQITIGIVDSVVTIACEVDHFDEADFTYIYTRAFDQVRACADAASFAMGWGLSVHIDSVVKPDGSRSTVMTRDETLAKYCTAFKINSTSPEERLEFQQVLKLLMSEPPLFMALNDLVASIIFPHHGPVNCARAIEGIRNMIAPSDRSHAWQLMRQNLNIDQAYLSFITSKSQGPRRRPCLHPGSRSFRASQEIMDHYESLS